MRSVRPFVPSLLALTFISLACSEPPDREMQQALGAIDAARAAGADQYARDELTAAQTALERAHDAVALGDYRLALNHALDSRERAQNAAMMAADGKGAARVEADHALTNLSTALEAAKSRLEAAEARRAPARTLAGPRKTIASGERSLQEARAAFDEGDYAAVVALDVKNTPILTAVADELAPPAPRRR